MDGCLCGWRLCRRSCGSGCTAASGQRRAQGAYDCRSALQVRAIIADNSATFKVRVRAEQQTPAWKARYAICSGVEGTINEFAHGHGMRHCRYRGQPKAHLQHVLTAIAVNIERLSGRSDTEQTSSPRPPTAFQIFLDQQGIPRSKSWRTLGNRPQPSRSPTGSS
ncbi:transposase [Streptomyces sp. NPDC056178]|uniref:transposase n=1 Tax=Streptomyces sp. NPDC056178 TaxID=3345735 RepID=UPI0035DF48D2